MTRSIRSIRDKSVKALVLYRGGRVTAETTVSLNLHLPLCETTSEDPRRLSDMPGRLSNAETRHEQGARLPCGRVP